LAVIAAGTCHCKALTTTDQMRLWTPDGQRKSCQGTF